MSKLLELQIKSKALLERLQNIQGSMEDMLTQKKNLELMIAELKNAEAQLKIDLKNEMKDARLDRLVVELASGKIIHLEVAETPGKLSLREDFKGNHLNALADLNESFVRTKSEPNLVEIKKSLKRRPMRPDDQVAFDEFKEQLFNIIEVQKGHTLRISVEGEPQPEQGDE